MNEQKAIKLSTFLYRDKYLKAGVPPTKVFFNKILTSEERFWCFYVLHEVTK